VGEEAEELRTRAGRWLFHRPALYPSEGAVEIKVLNASDRGNEFARFYDVGESGPLARRDALEVETDGEENGVALVRIVSPGRGARGETVTLSFFLGEEDARLVVLVLNRWLCARLRRAPKKRAARAKKGGSR
jgi:hypothetical protein